MPQLNKYFYNRTPQGCYKDASRNIPYYNWDAQFMQTNIYFISVFPEYDKWHSEVGKQTQLDYFI